MILLTSAQVPLPVERDAINVGIHGWRRGGIKRCRVVVRIKSAHLAKR